MKFFAIIIITLLLTQISFSQDITGSWNGILKVQNIQLRIVFNIVKTDSSYMSTMDSPDQGAKDIKVDFTLFENSILKLEIKDAKIKFNGELKDKIIVGKFNQGGQVFDLNLSKEIFEKDKVSRPQEPLKPYPYKSEDVTFNNKKANIKLAGTFTFPSFGEEFPVVVLISGSGPQNRDEELLSHKPFLVISDFLSRNGIAVLRYDDRGTYGSEGDFSKATSLDFASDVESAVEFLKTRKEVDIKKIGLIGHSEGGIIAPMVASKSKDIRFIILLSGTGVSGDKLLLTQQELISKASGVPESEIIKSNAINKKVFTMIVKSNNIIKLKTDLNNYLINELKKLNQIDSSNEDTQKELIANQVKQITTPWMMFFLKYDPAKALEKTNCAVLALNGSNDLQVSPKQNLVAISNSLKKGGNNNFTIKELPKLNHLFQESKTGSPTEYSTIEQTFSPIALEEILSWIKTQVK